MTQQQTTHICDKTKQTCHYQHGCSSIKH